MFDSRIINNTDNCNIIKHSLLNDLLPYHIEDNSIAYNGGSIRANIVSQKETTLDVLINQQSVSNKLEVWQPLIIDNDNFVNNKLLSSHGAYYNGNPLLKSGRIGIENIFSFSPQFKSWNSSNLNMSIDWFLNSANSPYAIYYGIMCWFRKPDSNNTRTNGSGKFEDFPVGTRISLVSAPTRVFVKINKDQLYEINTQSKTLTNGQFVFSDESKTTIVDPSVFGPDALFKKSDVNYYEDTSNNTAYSIVADPTKEILWIPDGDCFFYHNSDSEKIRLSAKGVPAQSYISPALYQKYSSIYRILTLDQQRSHSAKNLLVTRCYKRLAHALSTSPFIDDFSISALDTQSIKTILQQYIFQQAQVNTISNEISLFKNVLISISEILQSTIIKQKNNSSLFLDTSFVYDNNIVKTKADLINKLLSKYGAVARIESNTTATLSPKENTITYDNSGIGISQILDSYCGKNLIQQTVYNNQEIIFDQIKVSTKNTANSSNIEITDKNKLVNNIPLYDAGKPGFGSANTLSKTNFNPFLIYDGNVPYRYNPLIPNSNGTYSTYIYKTAVDDGIEQSLISNPNLEHCALLANEGLELTALDISEENINSYNEKSTFDILGYLENQNNYFWEKISGPPGSFDKNQQGLAGLSNTVKFYTSFTGKFVLQCTISSPFGTFKKQRTFYVIDGRFLAPINGVFLPNPNYGKYWDSINKEWTYPLNKTQEMIAEAQPSPLDKYGVKSLICKMNKFAINNISRIFWPIKTDFTVRERSGDIGGSPVDYAYHLESDYKFHIPYSDSRTFTYSANRPSTLLSFISNNTVMKVHSVFLEKIRHNFDDTCSQCLSFYQPQIKTVKSTLKYNGNTYNIARNNRTNKYPESFDLVAYEWDPIRKLSKATNVIEYNFNNISTSNAPKIKAYGGYNRKFVDSLGLNIPNHPTQPVSIFDQGLVANNPAILPAVTGFKMDYKNDKDPKNYKMIYQKAIQTTPNTGIIINFDKGVFHPSSGWFPYTSQGYKIHANRSSVLKFNTGARDSFSFVGPKVSNMNCAGTFNDQIIQPNIYSSSITLGIAKDVQWDPECSCEASNASGAIQLYNDNQKHKEYIDIDHHISNHGYRLLHGGKPKSIESSAYDNQPLVNDEFEANQSSTNFSYSFAVTGPVSLPEVINGPDGRKHYRIPRVNDFGIKDIEVKLNFLNYVNTKNLVVWLEVDYGETETKGRFNSTSSPPSSPLKSTTQFIDQTIDSKTMYGKWRQNEASISGINNTSVADYLTSLTQMNSNDSDSTTFKLFLLNQENIQNNSYNFSITFSDHASKYNVINDNNLTQTNNYYSTNKISSKQNIIKSHDSILPTLAANGYSDRDSCLYSSIIKNNKLNISNNTFSKFVGDTLFKGATPLDGPCAERSPKQKGPNLDGKTKFTLKMMVLDEIDDMTPQDNTITSQFFSGLETVENVQKSTLLYNSLCNWELILHVGPTLDPVPYTNPNLSSYGNCDALSLINYKKDPQYPGNSFIADLSAYKHLLPIANFNAPNSCIADSTTCLTTQDDPTGQGVMIKTPEFPVYAIIQILAGMAAYASTTGGTLVGALAGLAGLINNPGYNTIVNWFRETTFSQGLEDQGRQIYTPNYQKYPFGSPEKILINFKTINSLWYTLEATIFKYKNSPILKHNKYKFIKTLRGNGRYISEFAFKLVDDYKTLIDNNYITSIILSAEEFKKINQPYSYPGINNGDIVDISVTNDPVGKGLYIAQTGRPWISINDNTVDKLSEALHYLEYNSVLGVNNNIFNNTLLSDIRANKVIILPSRVPYDILFINDSIDCYSASDRLEKSPTSLMSAKIIKKGLIFKNNEYYSIFILDKAITSQDTISPSEDCNILFVYKNQSTIEDKINKPYNIWGLDIDKSETLKSPVDINPTTHSVGSYGDISPFVTKSLLTNNIKFNKLQNLHEIINNQVNDKLKYNKLMLIPSGSLIANTITPNSLCGFAYSEKDLKPIFDTKNNAYYISSESVRQQDLDDSDIISAIKNQIKLSTVSDTDLSYRYSYVRVGSSDVSLSGLKYGDLQLENDYIEIIPKRILTVEEINKLGSRLDKIDDQSVISELDTAVGDGTKTSSILNYGNLNYLIKHYNSLPNDPSVCFDQISNNGTETSAKNNKCYKKITENKINQIYIERNNIISILNDQAYIIGKNDNTTSYARKADLSSNHPDKLDSSILPKIDIVITSNVDNSLDISFKEINTDHYWINIDPKQSCFKDFASNPKILVSTTYTCVPANPAFVYDQAINNNVCPKFNSKTPIQNGPEESFEIVSVNDPGNSATTTDGYKYNINKQTIENKKQEYKRQYPSIVTWKTFIKTRYFNINGDETMDTILAPSSEITIISQEEYLVPVTFEDLDIFKPSNNDNSADADTVSGIPVCQTNYGSPAGKGLITKDGNRIGRPTRVGNIINLNNHNNIQVMIKKIPRMLRGVDLLSTVYRYGSKSIYRPANNTSPKIPFEVDMVNVDGSLSNSLYFWTALQNDPADNQLKPADLPEFFKLQNEMIFRAFFGSVDKIENKTDSMQSYYPWEMIPYEYL